MNGVKRPELRHPPVAINCRCDGNQVSALIGSNVQEGCVGHGDNLPEALRDLADSLEREVGEVLPFRNPLKSTRGPKT